MHCCTFVSNAITLYTICWIVFQYQCTLFRYYQQFTEL